MRPFSFFNPSTRPFPTHFNFAFHLQSQDMATLDPHPIFSFAIPILLNFLVLKYQNLDKSPFKTHPKTVLLGILSLLLYYFSYDYLQRIRMRRGPSVLADVLHRCILFFGYMVMASLASLLFPDSASPAFYALYITISVGDLLYSAYQRVRGRQFRGTRFGGWRNSPFLMRLFRILGQRNPNQGHLLPL